MHIAMKQALPRRTFLRGLGVSVALPLLDGMVPAFAALRTTPARAVKRFGAIYVPNGVEMRMWTPKGEGAGFEFSPILEPLEPFREQTFVLSGLADKVGGAGAGRRDWGPRASVVDVADGRAGEEDRRAGHPRGRVAGPDRGAAPGAGDAAGVAGAGAGLGGSAGGVRRRV